MNYKVKISIVSNQKPKLYKLYSKIFGGSFILLIFSFFIFYSIYIISFLTLIGFIFGILTTFTKGYNTSGFIVFSKECIIVNLNRNERIFPLNELNNIVINYFGYEGGFYSIRSITPKDGTGNFIEFYYENQKFKFELLFLKNNLSSLNFIFSEWKKNDVKFTLKNKFGLKTKSL
jgi:hypothetical protein